MRSIRLFTALILLGAAISTPHPSYAAVDVGVSINLGAPPPPIAIAPPPLPVYVVPAPPQPAYLWTPGYWFWNGAGYFWVPGAWVAPPRPGLLWTPGFWAWNGVAYAWYPGYWGPHVGFYGGVNYGGGYNGIGFVGGSWAGNVFNVNRAVIGVSFVSRGASFNGGPGGLSARASAEQLAFAHEQHVEATHLQMEHINAAAHNQQLAASFNHGKPPIAAVVHANDFSHGAVAASQGGARNTQAEQHNIAMKRDPSQAHGAALPRENGTRDHNTRGTNRAARTQPTEGVRSQGPDHPGRTQPNEAVRPQGQVQPGRMQPNEGVHSQGQDHPGRTQPSEAVRPQGQVQPGRMQPNEAVRSQEPVNPGAPNEHTNERINGHDHEQNGGPGDRGEGRHDQGGEEGDHRQ